MPSKHKKYHPLEMILVGSLLGLSILICGLIYENALIRVALESNI